MSTSVDVADDHRRQLAVTAQDHLEPIHGATQALPTKALSRLQSQAQRRLESQAQPGRLPLGLYVALNRPDSPLECVWGSRLRALLRVVQPAGGRVQVEAARPGQPSGVAALVAATDQLLDRVFPDLSAHATDPVYVSDRAALTTTNAAADKVNEILAACLQSDSRTHLSADSADDEEGGTPWVQASS